MQKAGLTELEILRMNRQGTVTKCISGKGVSRSRVKTQDKHSGFGFCLPFCALHFFNVILLIINLLL